jgi:hypothetical protein
VKATEKNIRSILRKWRPRLGLGDQWSIECRIYTDESWPRKNAGTVAWIVPSPGYFTATLHINADAVERDGQTLEHTVLHELVHLVAWPLSVIARDALGESQEEHWRDVMEATVEQMTRALLSR